MRPLDYKVLTVPFDNAHPVGTTDIRAAKTGGQRINHVGRCIYVAFCDGPFGIRVGDNDADVIPIASGATLTLNLEPDEEAFREIFIVNTAQADKYAELYLS